MASSELSTPQQALQSVADPIQDLIRSLNVKPRLFPVATKTLIQGETKYLTWDFNKASFDSLEILQITDAQFGHICCKIDRLKEYRDWVLARPNRYMVWTGDNVDSATMQSKGTTWENIGTPQSQVFQFCKLWAPAAHRVLGYVGGNHERRALTTFGDLGLLIAGLLQIPYSRGKQLIDIKFGEWGKGTKEPFQINQWHGVGGARTKGTVAQVLSRFMSEGDAHVYFMGHLHQPMVIPMWKERRGVNGIRSVKCIGALGSSFLENWGSYGEVSGYTASDVMMPRVVITRGGRWEMTLR